MTWTEVWQWLVANSWVGTVFGIVFLCLVLRLVLKYVFDRLEHATGLTDNVYDDAIIRVSRKPIAWGILLYGVLAAAAIVRDNTQTGVLEFIPQIREIGTIALLVWFAIRFISEVSKAVSSHRDEQHDRATIDAVAKLLRVSVLITGFLIGLQSLGFSIEGVLAFGGIGGIAVGFAARDMLANFFGAFLLLLDKPFAVGDWIRSSEMEIEGTVEEIGWRITRIRTFDKRPLYVPNSNFSNITIENPSRMTNRRIKETIGIRYDDMSVLPAVLNDIRSMLAEHDEIDTDQILMVNLNEFSDSSADFFIYTFTKTTDWARFHEIKEDVLLRIASIIEGHGAEIAFPTQTLHLDPVDIAQRVS
ncbi:MAG: mechanosensitive ion channel family protein [Gammaproteobacteria bacterium]|nr:mechanosensitive ion channel family protein [Gammaproteobacteria bacterium]